MTADQIIAVITAAKAAGISWLKAEGLEFKTGNDPVIPSLGSLSPEHNIPVNMPEALSPEEEADIKHKVEELKSVMQLGDEELIDRLFPEPKEEEIEAAS